MSGIRINSSRIASLALLIWVLLAASSPQVWCVDEDEYSKSGGNPKVLPLVTSLIYNQILNLTKIFNKEITLTLGYCTNDVWVCLSFPKLINFVCNTFVFLSWFCSKSFCFHRDADMNGAFKFSNDLGFLSNCVKETKGIRV